MGSCCGKAKEPEGAHVKKYEDRGCTDVLFWILFFVVGWVASIVVFSTAVSMGGNPDRYVSLYLSECLS
jgi:hypothetical protein